MSAKYQKVGYYPGCALEGTGHAYNRSTKALGKKLGLDLVEVKNWNCCGAMEVKNIDPKLQSYLSSRVMSIAANEMGLDTVMAPCNGCYHNLKKAEYDLANDPATIETVEKLSGKAGHKAYQAEQVETIHALDWIKQAIGEDGIRERVKNSLSGLKIANYYGCMYTRPRHIFPEKDQGGDSESTLQPHYMDDLLAAAGAAVVAVIGENDRNAVQFARHDIKVGRFIGREHGAGRSIGQRGRAVGPFGHVQPDRRFDARRDIGLQHAHGVARMERHDHAVAGNFHADGLGPAIGAGVRDEAHLVGADGVQQGVEEDRERFRRCHG